MVRFLVSAGAVLLGAASVTGFGTSPIALPARAGLQCVSRGQSARAGPTLGLRMQWSPEERQRREEARKAREAKILREREERQAKLAGIEQDALEQRNTAPINFETEQEGMVMAEGNYGEKATGLFGWANNNPSSKNAIYDTEFINSAAGGGNVGEMMVGMRGKGKDEYSKSVSIPAAMKNGNDMLLFYRQYGEIDPEGTPPLLFCHGLLDHSWSFRELMKIFNDKEGRTCLAFDFPGAGYSSWPQPGMDYDFTEACIKQTITSFVDAVGAPQVTLVVQGFVHAQYALLWGLENPGRVNKIVVLNTPILPGTKLPFELQQYQIPIVNSFVAQDAMRAERFLEAGSAYAMDVADADRFREPFLESMMPGLGVMDVMGKLKFDEVLQRTYEGLYQTTTPTLVSWGMQDSYLPATDAQACAEATGKEFRPVPGQAGFLVQMDYAESVYNAIRDFVR